MSAIYGNLLLQFPLKGARQHWQVLSVFPSTIPNYELHYDKTVPKKLSYEEAVYQPVLCGPLQPCWQEVKEKLGQKIEGTLH